MALRECSVRFVESLLQDIRYLGEAEAEPTSTSEVLRAYRGNVIANLEAVSAFRGPMGDEWDDPSMAEIRGIAIEFLSRLPRSVKREFSKANLIALYAALECSTVYPASVPEKLTATNRITRFLP